METNEKKGAGKKVFISIIVVLLLTNSFTLYQLFTENKAKTTITSEKSVLQKEFTDLTATLNQRSSELEQMKGKNAELDKEIGIKQEQLDKDKRTIESLFKKGKMNSAELAKAKTLIAQYEASIAEFGSRIDQLTRENQQLASANSELGTNLSLERSTTAKLSEENKGLSKKVEVGSLLPLAKIDVEAIRKRDNGKELVVKRAKAAESLKISFETGENKVLDPGPVSLYVRVINPKGETISVADQGSGTILSSEVAESVQYTKKADFDYNQTNKKVVVYWSQQIQTPGTYKVEVYQNGFVIGQSEVKLI